MHYLYILYSPSRDTYYTGETSDIERRIVFHNSAKNSKSFTKIATDWEVQLLYECAHRKDALYLESFIKRMKSRRFILKIINSPDILDDILSKR